MSVIEPAIGVGASFLGKLFGGNQADRARRRMADAIARYRGLNPGDYAEAGRIREGYGTLARQKGGQRAGQLITRYRQLGLDQSQPGLVTRGLDRINQDVADTTLQGSKAADQYLYDTKTHREDNAFNAEMGLYEQDQRRGEAKYAAFMNGLNEFFPTLIGHYGRGRNRALPTRSGVNYNNVPGYMDELRGAFQQ